MAFNFISSSTASSRLGLVAVMLAGLCLYMQYHLYSLPRANFNGMEYFEDSKNSECQGEAGGGAEAGGRGLLSDWERSEARNPPVALQLCHTLL
jgi:hypothetical protein